MLEADAVETVWQAGCLKVDALGRMDRFGNLATEIYRVELDGGDILYESESYTAVRHFLEMLTEPYPEYKVA
ncbi:hypothetical protein [Marinobacter zhejiangensis]|uniref:hypothetical protein n=1 Tax=Marinobacter zhejiangensis TaxID=488535 RepID=UPI001113FAEE|nr:hypothetical protein [Marinobacter zhejiangensis]